MLRNLPVLQSARSYFKLLVMSAGFSISVYLIFESFNFWALHPVFITVESSHAQASPENYAASMDYVTIPFVAGFRHRFPHRHRVPGPLHSAWYNNHSSNSLIVLALYQMKQSPEPWNNAELFSNAVAFDCRDPEDGASCSLNAKYFPNAAFYFASNYQHGN